MALAKQTFMTLLLQEELMTKETETTANRYQ